MFISQRIAYWFSIFAVLGFGLQGVVSNLGALDIIFPDLPSPIPFTAGRSFHVNISVFWTLAGIIGGIYYFFSQEAGRELYSLRLARYHFYLLVLSMLTVLGSLILGFNEGREYLEGLWPLRGAVVASLALLTYNLIRTYIVAERPKGRATLLSMLAGMLTLVIFYIPTLRTYTHPSLDELAKFLVVHLWEEMCLELVAIGIIGALLIQMTGAERRKIETILYLDIAIMTVGGVLGTGHHYYWIGSHMSWLWIGLVFSFMQIIPTLLLLYTLATSITRTARAGFGYREWLTLALLASSTMYHIFGAGLFGFFMAYPEINKYVHGTYITSAHSHLAVFGVFGFLVLSICVYILFEEIPLSKGTFRMGLIAVGSLNAGLLIMAFGLFIAGALQAYFWRVLAVSIQTTNELIRPYLILRSLGGTVYLAGSTLLTYLFTKNLWPYREEVYACRAPDINVHELNCCLRQLVNKEKEIITLVHKIKSIYKSLAQLVKVRK